MAVDPTTLMQQPSTGFMSGSIGDTLSSTNANPLGILPSILTGGVAAGQALGPGITPNYNTAQQQATSPWWNSGAGNTSAQQLSSLTTNPQNIFQDAAFQASNTASMTALEKQLSAQGYNLSGKEISDLSQLSNQNAYSFYQQQAGLLSNLAGVGFNPNGGVQAGVGSAQANANYKNNALSNLGTSLGQGSTSSALSSLGKTLAGGSTGTGNYSMVDPNNPSAGMMIGGQMNPTDANGNPLIMDNSGGMTPFGQWLQNNGYDATQIADMANQQMMTIGDTSSMISGAGGLYSSATANPTDASLANTFAGSDVTYSGGMDAGFANIFGM